MKNRLCYLLVMLLALPLQASALCLGCTCAVTATGVAFGSYNPFSFSDVSAASNVHLSCTGILAIGVVDYDIFLNEGVWSAGFPAPRQMDSGGNRLSYNLYTGSDHGTIWGDGTGGTAIVSDSITIPPLGSNSVDHTVYGLIPARQTSTAVGSYSDTVTVTVNYQ